ncbi:MAG: hypothetical protein AUH76_12900 [Candidatus Rokubacteria bacterium 13_1_40CM_4_67_11]|nr:MAG: hypothetical protein AUH76_12900 [Candidatus Rokubacteria bacterium 13_1_40CM_4_67_11]OLD31292.1 MAG: hypothetical protein AUI49_06865 [Candidatus Rokubacteria bacterium 13_1_40CM_2_68_13]
MSVAAVTALAPAATAVIVRSLGATLRIRAVGVDALEPRWRAGQPLIYAVWHGRMVMMPWLNAWLRRTRGARRVAVLASRSRDGEIVSRYVARFGLATIRGSSSRGGAGALRQLVATVRAGGDVAVVPDGPRGPRRQLQPGVVTLAALTGAPIVPLAFAARPARRLASWDEQLVPWPFARSVLVLGETIAVPRDADRERAVKEVERALNDTTADADRLVAS